MDSSKREIPAKILAGAEDLNVESRRIDIAGIDTFLRSVTPSKEVSDISFLFLHGQAFSSKVWHDLGSLKLMAASGYNSIAVDLPGYGLTTDELSSKGISIIEYMEQLFQTLKLTKAVMVVPSMSGKFGLPFLVKHSQLIAGFVPVAPIATETIAQDQLKSLQVPTMLIIGENDGRLATMSQNNLKIIPNMKVEVLENAGHAAYVDQPEQFHRLLFNFAKQLS